MRATWVLGAGLLLSLSLPVQATEPAADMGGPLPAVWKEQHLGFSYAGRTSHYSCDGLREKMRAMLLEMGARRDLKVSGLGCSSTSPGLRLEFSSPVLPDSAARPRRARHLIAVAARFEKFVLTSDAFRNFGIADCELVEDFSRQILPKLATRGVQADITCLPYQKRGSRYVVRGEILRSLPRDQQSAAYLDAVAP